MKSTTLRRSNITKEKIEMLEALSRYNKSHQDEDYYKTQNKTKELDALWQNFGIKPQKNEKVPQAYFITGLICGIIITLSITVLIMFLANLSTPKDDIDIAVSKKAQQSTEKFAFIPADNNTDKQITTNLGNEEYIVKSGDTLESIVIRYYGSFDVSKVKMIQSANKMSNPNALHIGQKLIIPMKQ